MKSFQGKTVVITGAGSGLGRALALKFNQAGANLALCDLNLSRLEETKNALLNQSLRTTLVEVDVTDQEAMESFAGKTIADHGQVDILINNAGITIMPRTLEEIPDELFKKVVEVNMWGVYNGTRAFLPHLKERPEASIVMVSSTAGLVGLYGISPYSMSKFAIRALAESLSMELASSEVQMLSVHPGNVKTDIIKNAINLAAESQESAHETFSRSATLTPEKAAEKILKAIKRKQNRLVMGFDAKLIYGIRNLFPRAYPKILGGMISKLSLE
jgi:NAD(P)-dependent dehydrogenase (short-subunit alcohol dehydrogenase family)